MQNATPTIKIGLWGASSAGKTTFVAALGRASLRQTFGWSVHTVGPNETDVVSTQAQINLRKWQGELQRLRFPTSTQTPGEVYTWVLSRPLPPPANPNQGGLGGLFGGMFGGAVAPAPAAQPATENVILHVRDVSGEFFSLGTENAAVQDQVMRDFAGYDGLIYLYDPAPNPNGEQGTFQNCVQNMGPALINKYLAACITKIDDSRVYFDPQTRDVLSQRRIIDSTQWADATSPPALMETLFHYVAPVHHLGIRNAFDANRVAYYATTSSGFKSSKMAEHYWDGIDWDDVQNSRQAEIVESKNAGNDDLQQNGSSENTATFKPVMVSPATPINVLEPFLWMYERMRLDGRFQ